VTLRALTLRAFADVPSLRAGPLLKVIRTALASASTHRFRVLHFSIQCDHLHLLVEANEPTAFERGVRGLAVRVAKAVNRVLRRRGRVWGDRYHARLLRTPREVRNALVYVLNNFRKHFRAARGLDVLVGGVVRWMVHRAAADCRRVLGGCAAHVARKRRLAAPWVCRCRRDTRRRPAVPQAAVPSPPRLTPLRSRR